MTHFSNTLRMLAFVCLIQGANTSAETNWTTDFLDPFDTFNHAHWQDQLLWVNDEDQCYVREGAHGTREVSGGTLKLRVVDLGASTICHNWDKHGNQHPPTQYVSGRIASKNRKEFTQGRWTARLRVVGSGQQGMFPAWWLLGALNDEPPREQPDETVCWPLQGSGEIDIFEHHYAGGAGHYAMRNIESKGYCDGGDWQAKMGVASTNFDAFHEYSVEWSEDGQDLIFRLDGETVYVGRGGGAKITEPMFAILNFAKIAKGPMTQPRWEMEVDWVKHESRMGR